MCSPIVLDTLNVTPWNESRTHICIMSHQLTLQWVTNACYKKSWRIHTFNMSHELTYPQWATNLLHNESRVFSLAHICTAKYIERANWHELTSQWHTNSHHNESRTYTAMRHHRTHWTCQRSFLRIRSTSQTTCRLWNAMSRTRLTMSHELTSQWKPTGHDERANALFCE